MLVSYTGLVPFGASVFFGCASYAVAFVMLRGAPERDRGADLLRRCSRWCWRPCIALIILRRRGLYFSLLTLAFSQIAFEIAFKWTDVTGGENGLQGVPRPLFTSDLVVPRLHRRHGRPGHAACCGASRMRRSAASLQALRDNEQRAQSLGYDTFRLKFVAFVIMGGIVGYAGGLLAFMLQGRLCRQSELAARRRLAADGGAGRRASLPRAAVGRHRLHSAGRPAVGDHRKLVADLRADRDPVRARLARGHAGPGVPPAGPHRLDTDAQSAFRRARRRSSRIAPAGTQAGSGQADPDGAPG